MIAFFTLRARFVALAFVSAAAVPALSAAAQVTRPGPQEPARDTSAQQAPARTPTGSISGRVLAADTGRPVKRARVRATAPEVPQGRAATTNDDGSFELAGLPAGRYSLNVSKAGYIPLAYGQRRPLQAGTPLQLADGQQLKGVEFRLPRGGVISGHVADENGDPMIGAIVRVLRYQYLQGDRRMVPVGTAQTDDRGEYRVWGLNPGDYYVSVLVRNVGGRLGDRRGAFGPGGNLATFVDATNDEQDPLGYAPTFYPGTTSAADARPVPVGISQEVLGIDFGIQLVRTATIAGRVVNPDGTGTSSGTVSLMPETLGGRGQLGMNYGSRLEWDGTFTIANVPPGRYVIRARGNDSDTPQYAAAPLTVAGSDLTGVNLVLAPSAALSGRVVFQAQQGTPGDPGTIWLSAVPADQGPFGPTPNARVEKNGQFVLDGIPAGAHVIRPVNPPRGWALKSIVVDGRDVTDAPIDFRPSQRISGAVVTFTNQLTQIVGTVADDSGRPLTEYTLLAFPTDTTLWRPLSRQIMTTRPDQNGRYMIRGLPPGDYYLVAVDPTEAGEWFEPAFLDQQRTNAVRLSLSDGDQKTQDFRVGAR